MCSLAFISSPTEQLTKSSVCYPFNNSRFVMPELPLWQVHAVHSLFVLQLVPGSKFGLRPHKRSLARWLRSRPCHKLLLVAGVPQTFASHIAHWFSYWLMRTLLLLFLPGLLLPDGRHDLLRVSRRPILPDGVMCGLFLSERQVPECGVPNQLQDVPCRHIPKRGRLDGLQGLPRGNTALRSTMTRLGIACSLMLP